MLKFQLRKVEHKNTPPEFQLTVTAKEGQTFTLRLTRTELSMLLQTVAGEDNDPDNPMYKE